MKVSSNEIRSRLDLLGFLDDCPDVGDRESLRDAMVLDSLRLGELVAKLEADFGIRVSTSELLPQNFDTIEAIVRFVAARSVVVPISAARA